MLSQKAIDFLMARGLDPEIAVKMGWSSEKGDLVIPYSRGDRTVNRKYRNLDSKTWRQDSGGEKTFWNIDCLTDVEGHDLIITEGEFDALALIQSGFSWVISVPDGAPAEAHGPDYDGNKYSYLTDATLTQIRKASRIVLATDSDRPGRALAHDLALRIGRDRCAFVKYPKRDRGARERCKDMNETLQVWGPDACVQAIDRAVWWNRPSVRTMADIPPAPFRSAFMAGIDGFDELFRFRMGDLSVWTGIPGHGKSTFINHVMASLSVEQNWHVTFASFEQDPSSDHRRALRSWYLMGSPEHCTDDQIKNADDWINHSFTFVCHDADSEEEMLNLSWLIDCMKAAVFRHGCKVFVIDPWNELEHDKPRDMTLTEYTGAAIRELRRQARSLNVHIAIVAHPAKMSADDDMPGLYAISDSAHWANKPDLGAVVYRDTDTGLVTFKTLKVRYDILGHLGQQVFTFDQMSRRYRAISQDEAEYIETGSA